jgi:Ca2+-binding RTX toxin-like protein
VLSGGAGADTIDGGGSADTLNGGDGDDIFSINVEADFLAAETINGGSNTDTIRFVGEVTTINDANFTNKSDLEVIQLTDTDAQTLVLGSNAASAFNNIVVTINAGATSLTLDASSVGASDSVTVTGTNNADTLTGGDGNDSITGGSGADTLTGGLGNDAFVYTDAGDAGDRITDFTQGDDLIRISAALTGSGTGSFNFGDPDPLTPPNDATKYDFIVFDDLSVGGGDAAAAADIALGINAALNAASYTNEILFILADGDNSTGGDDGFLWRWVDTADGEAVAGELTLFARIVGLNTPLASDITIFT